MVNWSALVVSYKQPFVNWINAADSDPESAVETLDDVNDDPTIYLLGVEDEQGLTRWLRRNHLTIFKNELN